MADKTTTFKQRFEGTKLFTFTIVPGEEHLSDCDHDLTKFYSKVRRYIWAHCFQWHHYTQEVILYPDISLPDAIQYSKGRNGKKGTYIYPRIHYHGVIKLKSRAMVPFFMMSIYKLAHKLGRIEIDTIKNYDEWLGYCKKYVDVYPNMNPFKIKFSVSSKGWDDDLFTDSESDSEEEEPPKRTKRVLKKMHPKKHHNTPTSDSE